MASRNLTDLVSFFPPISSSSTQIRLLELHPGTSSADIYFNYKITSLNSPNLPYEALSYAWRSDHGDKFQCQSIYIDGNPIEVSQSLFEALKQLRRVSEKRHLWIDAICINQADDHEKTRQVNLMRRIYTQCTQCIIWLGSLDHTQHSPEDAQMAVDTIAWIAGENNMPPWHRDLDFVKIDRAATAIKTLMTVSWWQRIWTVQEATLPPRATLQWGPAQLPWELMDRAADHLIDGPEPRGFRRELDEKGGLTDLMANVRGLKASRNERPLFLFWRWRFRDSTDPRDKIYGLMGIRENLSMQSVQSCDYTIDVGTLYCRVTADLIRMIGDLEPLIGRRGEEQAIEGLPTWAIDWSRAWSGDGYWLHQPRWNHLGYTADRGIYGVGDGLRISDNERILILSGVFVDKIAVVEVFDGDLRGSSTSALLLSGGEKWGRLFDAFQSIRSPRQSDGKWMRDFLGLIMGRLDPENPDHGDVMEDWVSDILRSQALFVTEGGRVGVGPTRVQPGHELWILGGCRFPVILDVWKDLHSNLSAEGREDFTFVGDCFVYGIMKGEEFRGKRTLRFDCIDSRIAFRDWRQSVTR